MDRLQLELARVRAQDPDLVRLDTLELGCGELDSSTTEQLFFSISTSTVLEAVSLPHAGLSNAEAFARLLASAPNMRILSLAHNRLDASGAEVLANAFTRNSTLWTLDLSHNPLGSVGCERLLTSLRGHPSLMVLDLAHAIPRRKSDGQKQDSPSLGKAVSDLLHSQSLRRLNVGGFRLAQCLESIVDSVCFGRVLRVLELGSCALGDAGAAALSRCCSPPSELRVLYLYDNDIGDAGASALADALEPSSRLRMLKLTVNRVGRKGAASFAAALSRRPSNLQHLILDENQLDQIAVAGLLDALAQVPTLLSLGLFDNPGASLATIAVARDLTQRNRSLAKEWERSVDELDVPGVTSCLKAGVPWHLEDSVGYNALHLLAARSSPADSRLGALVALLAANAKEDLFRQADDGSTPLDIARDAENETMTYLLEMIESDSRFRKHDDSK